MSCELESLVLLIGPWSDHSSKASSDSSCSGLLLGQHESPVSCESDTASLRVIDKELLSVVSGGSDLDLPLAASDGASDVENSSSVSSGLDLERSSVGRETKVSSSNTTSISGSESLVVAVVACPVDHWPVVGVPALPDVNTEVVGLTVVKVLSSSWDVSDSHISLSVPGSEHEVVASGDSGSVVVGEDEVGVVGESD